MVSRDDALALDASDALAMWRDHFDLTSPGAGGRDLVYLDGNSLGRAPLRTFQRLDEVLRDEWASGLIRSWDQWLNKPQEVGDLLAPLIGAAPGEVTVHDSTTVNLYPAGARRTRAAARSHGAGDRRARLPQRPLRGRRHRVCHRAHGSARFRSPRRRRGRGPFGGRLPHRRSGRHRGRDRSCSRRLVLWWCGTCRTRQACWPSISTPRARSWPSAAPTSS